MFPNITAATTGVEKKNVQCYQTAQTPYTIYFAYYLKDQ